ncbi:thioesterase family protein [Alicyclobacillus sp. SP_1]|uniref:acyl-CoA thioesterase n=1 Tax=Alicyclobacillus sp. SP_1 TaxID=2942475 RepID=UPI002157A28A|nr:thioesterase family protein [Alicyclobacillus sp. SP_1]
MESISEIRFQVRSTEIDVNAHVNNAKFLEYLEWGREDWFERRGLDYEYLLGLDVITVLARIEANYRKEARQNDTLRVETQLISVGNTSLKMRQCIDNQRGELVLDAIVIVVTVEAKLRRPTRVPDAIRRHLSVANHET